MGILRKWEKGQSKAFFQYLWTSGVQCTIIAEMSFEKQQDIGIEIRLRLIGEWIETNIQNEESKNVINSIEEIAEEITDLKRAHDVRLREENEWRQIRRTAYLKRW